MFEFTKRELEILTLAAQGFKNKEIGKQTFISTHTVKAHMKSIMQKLGVTNRTEAAYIAIKNHIIE